MKSSSPTARFKFAFLRPFAVSGYISLTLIAAAFFMGAVGADDIPPNPITTSPQAIITGPTSTAAGELVVFDAGESTGGGYDWEVLADKTTKGRFRAFEDGQFLAFASPDPGVYKIVLSVAKDNKSTIAVLVLVNGKYIPPDPDVDPDIDPDIDPPNNKWQIAIIYERGELDNYTPEQQSIIKSLTFRKSLTDAGHIIVPGGIVDQHVKGRDGKVPKSLAPYLAACGDDKLPRICISSKTVEEVPRSFYIPVDADDESILELLKGAE